jgi:hypothetical protein
LATKEKRDGGWGGGGRGGFINCPNNFFCRGWEKKGPKLPYFEGKRLNLPLFGPKVHVRRRRGYSIPGFEKIPYFFFWGQIWLTALEDKWPQEGPTRAHGTHTHKINCKKKKKKKKHPVKENS